MMDQKYLDYSIEELVDDRRFAAWAERGEHASEWEDLIRDNPSFGEKAEQAREILLLLREPDPVHMDEAEKQALWEKIERYHAAERGKKRTMVRKVLPWAASLLLMLALGGGMYYHFQKRSSEYSFSSLTAGEHGDYARLILADGEKINIKRTKSSLFLDKDLRLVINNDSIIDLSKRGVTDRREVKMNEMIVPYGKRSEIILPDSTRVILNAGSRLAFPSRFDRKKREVFLEGEAYFEVTRNDKHPFVVNAGRVSIRVLGTHFNVSAYTTDPRIETVLLEGKVSVYEKSVIGRPRNEVVLQPFQKASYDRQHNIIRVSDEKNAEQYISWTEGWLDFTKKSLPEVFKKVERFYNVRVILPDTFVSKTLITGKLDINESLDDVMKALADVGKFSYRIEGDSIYIVHIQN